MRERKGSKRGKKVCGGRAQGNLGECGDRKAGEGEFPEGHCVFPGQVLPVFRDEEAEAWPLHLTPVALLTHKSSLGGLGECVQGGKTEKASVRYNDCRQPLRGSGDD